MAPERGRERERERHPRACWLVVRCDVCCMLRVQSNNEVKGTSKRGKRKREEWKRRREIKEGKENRIKKNTPVPLTNSNKLAFEAAVEMLLKIDSSHLCLLFLQTNHQTKGRRKERGKHS